jgi:signal transduction histidine kinase
MMWRNRLRSWSRWWTTVKTDDPLRLVLNQGLITTLSVLIPLNILALLTTSSPDLLLFGDLFALLLAVWLARRGTPYGALLFTLVAIVGNALALDPASLLTKDYPVPMVLLFPAILATLFVAPHAGVWAIVLQIAAVGLALWSRGASMDTLLYYLPGTLIDLGALTAIVMVGASIFRSKIREVVQANAELEERVVDRTAALRQLMERRQKESTAVVHDLTNGLLTAQLGVDTLLLDAQLAGVDPQALAQAEQQVAQGLGAARALAEDLRTAALLENASLELQRELIDLGAIADQVVQQMKAQAGFQQILLESDIAGDLPWVFADARRVERVLANLVENAIKYTANVRQNEDEADVVRVSVDTDELGVRVRVSDTGPGMDAATLERLGRPFTRLETSSGTEGMGIGLYISRGVIEQHGGTLTFESDGPGCGTTAMIWLPFEKSSNGQAAHEPVAALSV